ncbi:MAG: L-seryl-tRNA(Sec) selenium transferase, partial [Gemmatimonadetes bacterium]|nr:L-seryl-tRNA(Sec) selenium transferase [Gemmatimonadota bacterium]
MTAQDPRRRIPGVDRLLERPWCRELTRSRGRGWIAERLRALLDDMRAGRLPVPDDDDGFAALLHAEVARAELPSLRRVVNATGVVLHTNLGRAPLAAEARRAMAAAAGYGNVEFDLDSGRRGSRYEHCAELARELTGAEDAVVVNNGAGAVALALTALAAGRGVVVSHGEMVEIGGGFRIPEVVEAAGSRLITVGTTNRTRRADYARAVERGDVGAILKVHRSNFAMSGFTEETELAELVAVGAGSGTPVIHDLGSGLLIDSAALGLPHEPTPAESVAAGVDLVAFSGDKLLGGPQAGVLVGTRAAVAAAKAHPLCRALRCDKVTLAGLEATLALYRDPDRARERIPALRMIGAGPGELGRRAQAVLAAVGGQAGGAGGGGGAARAPRPRLAAAVARGGAAGGGGGVPGAAPP